MTNELYAICYVDIFTTEIIMSHASDSDGDQKSGAKGQSAPKGNGEPNSCDGELGQRGGSLGNDDSSLRHPISVRAVDNGPPVLDDGPPGHATDTNMWGAIISRLRMANARLRRWLSTRHQRNTKSKKEHL
jgi:hypothetical protein